MQAEPFPSESEGASKDEVRAVLAQLLASKDFPATTKRRAMLRFVVEETLVGRARELKGFTIATAVYGRDHTFDPRTDPVVRLEARRLRHDLSSYYVGAGAGDLVRISIPKGAYVPVFERRAGAPLDEPEPETTMPEAAEEEVEAHVALRPRRTWPRLALVAAGVVAMVAAVGSLFLDRGAVDASSATGRGDLPAVAIGSIVAVSDNDRDHYLAFGISNQLANDLSRFSGIRVFFPTASRDLRDPGWDAEHAIRRPDISHVVTGTLRSDKENTEIAVQLTDTRSGEIIWSDSYRSSVDLFQNLGRQDNISARIASSLGEPYGAIMGVAESRMDEGVSVDVSSHECILSGYYYKRSFSPALYQPLYDCVQAALRNDPDYADAWAMRAWLRLDALRFGHIRSPDPDITLETAVEAGMKAIALEPENILGLNALSAINHYRGDFEEGERFARLALHSNPNNPYTLVQLGWRLAVRGDFAAGVPLIERAVALSLNPPGWYFHLLAIDRLMKGDGEAMRSIATSAVRDGSAFSQSLLAMACGLLEDRECAKRALAAMNEISPGLDPVGYAGSHQAADEILAAMTDALESAGWTSPGSVR
ncbi:tetratricopeptide repeat protein [Pikeienuella piscinae]|nr:hypothetical protein [Pikeienuella piscinae]